MSAAPPPLPGHPLPLAPPAAVSPAGANALYSPRAVALATFLGSPIAGTAILAMNYRRLGKMSSAIAALLLGLIATAAIIGLGFVLPSHSPGVVIAVVTVVIMAKLAQMLQGDALDRHKLAGGKIASMWKAAGVGLLSLVILVGLIFTIAYSMIASAGTHLAFGKSEVVYSGSATAADAQALGKALTDIGYFGGQNASTVLLAKNTSGVTLKFVVNEDAGRKETTLQTYAGIADAIAPAIGGKPFTLKLLSPDLKELQSKTVEGALPAAHASPAPVAPPVVTSPPINHQKTVLSVPGAGETISAPSSNSPTLPARVEAAPDDASKFSGLFRNEKITVEFTAAGPAQVTGTIKLDDRQFPASAHVENGQLVGSFDSDGTKFDFTADIQGSAMHFKTGRSTFTLNKRVNPLQQ